MTVEDILATLIAFGSVSRAHRPDEYVEIGEVAACRKMIEDLGARLAA